MKRWLTLATVVLVGAIAGVMIKTVVAAHTAAAQPPVAPPAGATTS